MFPRRFVFATAPLFAYGVVSAPQPVSAAPKIEALYVVMGSSGPVARAVLTGTARCPLIRTDARRRRMAVRSLPQSGDAAAFPVLVCEFLVPSRTRSARVQGQALPLPKPLLRRAVAFGDTGCRLKSWEQDGHPAGEYQNCDTPSAWPFPLVAGRAATLKPGLIIHVGDYIYREAPCPAGDKGCKGSPSGDNWNTWKADFFAPARPLLRTAPWIMARGNHEICKRSGTGYFLLLDPALADKQPPACADFTPHYTVKTGGRSFIVMDSSNAVDNCARGCDTAPYAADFAAMKPDPGTWLVTHKPLWAFTATMAGSKIFLDTETLQQALRDGRLPQGFDLLLAGHIHLWELLAFADKRPPQLVVGTGGTAPDPALDGSLTGHQVLGTTVSFGRTEKRWGFTVLKPHAIEGLTATFIDVGGKTLHDCTIEAKAVACRP